MRRWPACVGSWTSAAVVVLMAGFLAGCGRQPRQSVEGVIGQQGLTQVTTTAHFIAVLNVVPPERMFTASQAAGLAPGTAGELILFGDQGRIGPETRHTEVHVYDKATGAAVSDATVSLTVQDRATGQITPVPATKMQDLALGAIDVHYGNNTELPAGHDFTITAVINGEPATFTGTLR